MQPIHWSLLAAGLLVTALCAAFFAVLRWAYKRAFYNSDRRKAVDAQTAVTEIGDDLCREPMMKLVQELEALPFERVSIISRDGLKLVGKYYRFSDSNRMEILFNGWRSYPLRDACGGAKIARDIGYNLLIVDQRAHGESDGNTITFGVKEKYDCLDWVNYCVNRFGKDIEILLGGVSMGAATVLMASALPLPPNVKAITADCGYTSPEAIIRKVCNDMGIPDRLGYPFVRMSARLLGHFSLSDGGALEAVKHATVPIMIMHGEEDDFVPYAMCHELYNAVASEKQLLTIPRAGHGLAYFYDTETYTRAVGAFKEHAFSSITK